MKLNLLLLLMLLGSLSIAQTVKKTNVYPTNLEGNMYYDDFNTETNIVKGIYCMILSDGENSEFVTPAFEVSLYLLPLGSSSMDDIIIVKKYSLEAGIYHMGSYDIKEKSIDLNAVEGLQEGNYRLGIWVNSNTAFEEDDDDNAMLFKGTIEISKINDAIIKNNTEDGFDNDLDNDNGMNINMDINMDFDDDNEDSEVDDDDDF